MKLKSTYLNICRLTLLTATAPLSLQAANPNNTPGDLVLYFQQKGGAQTIYCSLGSAETLKNATAPISNLVNISSQLTTAFGSTWASDTTVYAGLAGTNFPPTTGDPVRTSYISAPRNTAGTAGQANSSGSARNLSGTTQQNTLQSQILAMMTPFENSYTTQTAVVPTGTSQIDDKNPFFGDGQGTAFGVYSGGVQQVGSSGTIGTIAPVSNVEFALDCYRLDPTTIQSNITAAVFQGTVVLDASGNVSFIPEVTSSGTVSVDSITTGAGSSSGTKVTIAFTATGNVDVYASTDLQTWGSPVATNVASSPFVEDNLSNPKRFYVLVPAGTAYPPAL